MSGFLLTNGFTAAGALDTTALIRNRQSTLLRAGLSLYEDHWQCSMPQLVWARRLCSHRASLAVASRVYIVGANFLTLTITEYDTFGERGLATQHHRKLVGLCLVTAWLKLAES